MIANYFRLLMVVALVVENTLGQQAAEKPITNQLYLGSEPAKAYSFPWMVSIHKETNWASEMFGSGAILGEVWVLASMDSFVRNSIFGTHRPYYQDVEEVAIYSSGVWGTPYLNNKQQGPNWLDKRAIYAMHMFSDPDVSKAKKLEFYIDHEPPGLNALERSPFGFSMSIALIRVHRDIRAYPTFGVDRWLWRRITLPIPLFANRASQIKIRLDSEVERAEKDPFLLQCFVGGWRLEDHRLVQHKVVYVPFNQCESVYCGFTARACQKWPVKGVHVCFKSLSFTDLCWPDQGSALYCESISESVIAILTSAPTCGVYGLPAVFTMVHHGMALLEGVAKPEEMYRPLLDLTKYTPPPKSQLIPAYR